MKCPRCNGTGELSPYCKLCGKEEIRSKTLCKKCYFKKDYLKRKNDKKKGDDHE